VTEKCKKLTGVIDAPEKYHAPQEAVKTEVVHGLPSRPIT
jgi:hypothetical protein